MTKALINKKNIAILLIITGGIICGILAGFFLALTHDLPQIRSLEDFRPSAITRIYSSDKVLLSELFVEKRDPVPFKIIPEYLKKAIITTEDRKFYTHSGIDVKGIVRAIIKDILAGKFVEGASTITQQLAKTLFLNPKKTIVRKLKEAFMAFQLEHRYTKDEILELYLNQIYFGSGAYGVESAARIFFNKSVKDLTLAECSLVSAMPKAPSRYSPLVNIDLAIKRRNIVLKQMLYTNIINETEYNKALNETLNLSKNNINSLKAPYFVEYVKDFLENIIGSSRLYKGGLTIYTTLYYELQKTAEDAIARGLSDLESRMKQQGIINPDPQSALVCLDIQSGRIFAMIGGKDFYKSPYNRAAVARRQPGSAFKPIVYAHAIEKGFTQNMKILDAPVVFRGGKAGEDWKPENFSKNYQGEITLRKALALSKNIPAVRLIEMLGPSSVVQFGYKLGIESTLSPNLSLVLGTSEVTLLELTAAYTVFPNMGKSIKPYGVMEVVDHNGRIVWRAKPKKRLVMSRTGAAIMTDMLTAVVKEGTGQKANIIKRPVAGKTGTTDKCKDALFIGFSPSIATGVWVGRDKFVTLGEQETGARAALPIWMDFMEKALANKPFQYFDIPDDMVRVHMNSTSGLLENAKSPNAVTALFKKGTEPRKY
ncbi:MAG: PBP1A family penicillin-binding protein [Desulfobacteraceae bacterium]|nr:PBP1A family penicillin-binding protein [Desulfobacteraceae bacterium]MBC2720916.1 PBP1A family penicillin-binding protein [Desulfobacteraceae bacterium]